MFTKVCGLLPLLAFPLLMTGCDVSGQYDARRKISLTEVAARSEVTKHLGPAVSVTDAQGAPTKLSFAPPKLLGTNPAPPDKLSTALTAVAKYDAATSKGEGPTLYVCVFPTSVGDLDQIMKTLEEGIKQLSPNVAVAPEMKNLLSLTNTPLEPMRYLKITGEQRFLVEGANNSITAKDVPGIAEVYVATAPQHYVAFIFRATADAAQKNDFEAAINASMRSVNIAK